MTIDANNLEKINEIIAKIRTMYKCDYRVNKLILNRPKIELFEGFKGELVLGSIEFKDDDLLTVSRNRIVYFPCYGGDETLLRYSGWDELLNL